MGIAGNGRRTRAQRYAPTAFGSHVHWGTEASLALSTTGFRGGQLGSGESRLPHSTGLPADTGWCAARPTGRGASVTTSGGSTARADLLRRGRSPRVAARQARGGLQGRRRAGGARRRRVGPGTPRAASGAARYLPARWRRRHLYQRRFSIAPGFRDDKKQGWQWEDRRCQASPITSACCSAAGLGQLGGALPGRAGSRRPEHARASLFTLGLGHARQWRYRPRTVALCWHLPALLAERWTAQWQRAQGHFAHFPTVRP